MDTKKDNSLHLLIIFFSSISILMGIYQITKGDSFLEHLSTFLIGISLLGVGIINYKSSKKE